MVIDCGIRHMRKWCHYYWQLGFEHPNWRIYCRSHKRENAEAPETEETGRTTNSRGAEPVHSVDGGKDTFE